MHEYGNSLLDMLLAAGASVSDDASVVAFKPGAILLDSNATITHVFFPLDMMISTTTLMQDGAEIEVGTIGREGMAGVQLVLGIDHVPGKVLTQVAGSAVRISAQEFLQSIDQSSAARKILLRYVQAITNLLEISIACNALHSVERRCARWLLITQNRVGRSEFGLTQEFLAGMLGVRRATVNAVAQDLQGQNAIRYARGKVHILDRAKLESASCECYKLSIDRYAELLGQDSFRRMASH